MKIVWMLFGLVTPDLCPPQAAPAFVAGEDEPEEVADEKELDEVADEEEQDEVADEDPTFELGRAHCRRFLTNALTELWDSFTPELKSAFGGRAAVAAHRRDVLGDWGFEAELLTETLGEERGFRTYSRVARFEKSSPLIEMYWAFDDEDRVAAYHVRRKYVNAPTEHTEHVTTTDLRLPVEGEWRVLAGGRDVSTNHHAASFDQRFALDLFLIKEERAYDDDGKRNELHYAFGERVLAPGAGVVHAAVDGVADNLPGFPNMREPLGNHVIVDHENGEYSFLAHLKQGSVAVEKGARVKAGDLLGLAGNSGDSKVPHVHHHLQLTGVFLKGDGLPAQFQGYVADDEAVLRGEPVQRQRVRMMTGAERKAAEEAAAAAPADIGPPKRGDGKTEEPVPPRDR